MKSFFGRFLEWQNYVHYFLLTVGLFLWHSIPYTSVLEGGGNYFSMFFWYLLGLFLFDTVVHWIFWVLPKDSGRWRD